MNSLVIPDEVSASVPPGLKGKINQNIVDLVLDMYADPDLCESYRDNMMSWQDIIDGRVTLEQYVNAVKFVSLRMVKRTNKEAFALTFPDRVNDWVARGVPTANQDSYVSAYNNNRLVKALWERSMISVHVFHHDTFNKAVKTQATIMDDPMASFTARVKAADSLLTHLKPPETQKIEVTDTRENTELDALKGSIAALVEEQTKAISSGSMSAHDVAESAIFSDDIVDGDFEEIEEDINRI